MNNHVNTFMVAALLCLAPGISSADPIEEQLQDYQRQGVGQVDIDSGRKLWYSREKGRSCTSCHGDSPGSMGQHAKTRKPIEPMASSVNPERFQDSKKTEKWFLRNCKWTFGRTCTIQEKANILIWLTSQ